MIKKILVLTDDMPWGHRSIARAIYGHLKDKKDLRVDYAEVKAETMGGTDAYVLLSRFLPSVAWIPHKLIHFKKLVRLVNKELYRRNGKRLERTIKRFKPDLVICSYCFHSHVLVGLRLKKGLKFELWNVAADPTVTISPYSFVPEAELNLVYDKSVAEKAVKWKVSKDKIFETGWWTRREMYQKYDVLKIKKELGVKPDRPVVFVGGGSLGTNSLTKLLMILVLVKKPVTVIVNTGTDRAAFKLVAGYKKILYQLTNKKQDWVQILNMGWIEDMAKVLSVVDIVFGKAGPNFLFDVVAASKPFVAITHVRGQEDGNLDLIRQKKLGWVKEKTGEAGVFLLKYLRSPEKYNKKFSRSIAKEAKKNRESLELIYKKIISC